MNEWDADQEPAEPVVVPHGELSPDALLGVVESFVLREGTDYGERDVSHADKVAQVMRQLERGEAQIMFEPVSGTIHIVLRDRAAGRPVLVDLDPGRE